MGLAATAAKLLASLDLDTKPFERGAKRAGVALGGMERRFGKIGGMAQKGLSNAAKNLTRIGVVAAGAIALAVRGGIESLAELERANQQTGAVIESTGGKAGVTAAQVRSLAESLESLTTVDDKVIQSGQNMLLTFTNIGQDVFPMATKAMVDMAVAMNNGNAEGIDLKTTAIQIGKALNDPIKGVGALRKVGVALTESQQQQITTLLSLTKEEQAHYLQLRQTSKAQATAYKEQQIGSRISEAQKIILAELTKEFGKAGEAAGTGFGGDLRRLDDAFEDTRMALATGFLPVIRKVADFLTKKLMDPSVQADIRRFGDTLAGAFDSLLETGKQIPWGTIGDSLKIAGAGAKAVLDAFASMPAWVQTAVISGWGLNKLTGGMLGGIVGEIGKGLIKGVLGINAGVVNVNAATVNGGGGVPGAVGGAGRFGGIAGNAAALIGPTAVVAGGMLTLQDIQSGTAEGTERGARAAITGFPGMIGRAVTEAIGDPLDDYLNSPPKAPVDIVKVKPQGLSPDERQEHNDTQQRLTSLDDRLQAVRDRTRDVKFATDQARIANVAATRTGDASIVAAIRGIQRPVINVNVSQATTTVTYATGGTLSRYYGKTVPI